tara:strand:- start:250 stop:777 length:528 start_codon:yes stop_codon:yes gene_type:complete
MAIKLKLIIDDKKVEKIILKAKRALDGSIIVSDHPDVDIMVFPQKNKIVAIAKDQLDDEVYESQKRFFKFLVSNGIVGFDSVQDGNLFMSKEAKILPMAGPGDPIQYSLYSISKFIENEAPFYKDMKSFEKEMEQKLLEPEIDEYTEFDPARHSDQKGTLPPKMVKYGISSVYRL